MTQVTERYQEKNQLLSLRNDAVLQLFFTKEENRPLLREFLKAVTHLTDDDLVKIEIRNSKLTKENVGDKDFIVDIHLTSVTGHKVIIEMQIQNHANFIERVVSYNARNYASQLKRGESYTQLKESITLVIVDFKFFDDANDFSEHILFRRKNRKIFTKAQQFYIIDLTKLPEEITETKHKWGALFKMQTEEELRVLMNESEVMKEAGEKLLNLSADEEAREIAQAREDAQMAWMNEYRARYEQGIESGYKQGIESGYKQGIESGYKQGIESGYKQGITEGVEQQKIEIAKNALKEGASEAFIKEITGLDLTTISQLKSEAVTHQKNE